MIVIRICDYRPAVRVQFGRDWGSDPLLTCSDETGRARQGVASAGRLSAIRHSWDGRVAERLCRSVRTIDHHLEAVFSKLNVSTRTEAAAAATRAGISTKMDESTYQSRQVCRGRKAWKAWRAGCNRNRSASRSDAVPMRLIGLIAAAVCLVASAPASAQPAAKVPRIGVLWQTAPPPPVHPHLTSLIKRLQEHGWEDGRTIAIEYRYGSNDPARLSELASELVRMKVDVITTAGDLSTRVAQQATIDDPDRRAWWGSRSSRDSQRACPVRAATSPASP